MSSRFDYASLAVHIKGLAMMYGNLDERFDALASIGFQISQDKEEDLLVFVQQQLTLGSHISDAIAMAIGEEVPGDR